MVFRLLHLLEIKGGQARQFVQLGQLLLAEVASVDSAVGSLQNVVILSMLEFGTQAHDLGILLRRRHLCPAQAGGNQRNHQVSHARAEGHSVSKIRSIVRESLGSSESRSVRALNPGGVICTETRCWVTPGGKGTRRG